MIEAIYSKTTNPVFPYKVDIHKKGVFTGVTKLCRTIGEVVDFACENGTSEIYKR